jgi:hypothetical protein
MINRGVFNNRLEAKVTINNLFFEAVLVSASINQIKKKKFPI